MKRTSPILHKVFQSLSDPYRIRIVVLMLRAKSDVCLCELSDSLEEPEYKLSRHIKVLKGSGIIGSIRQGKWIYHSLKRDQNFLKALHKTISFFPVTGSEFDSDFRRFEKRRMLREDGRCQMPVRIPKRISKVSSRSL
jgi:ArsR family transcriptional regulator